MLARLAAVAAAVAMVVGAVALRGRLDDRQEDAATELRLVCSSEMASTCGALAAADPRLRVTVEAAGTTAARLVAQDVADLDGWLVAGPWPALVAEARDRAGREPLLVTSEALARSPVMLVVWDDRAAVLATRCNGEISWRCVGDSAGTRWSEIGGQEQWGPVKPAHAPVGSAEGLAVVGAATVGYFGRSDLSRADLDDDGYRAWLARLERNLAGRSSAPVEDMLLRGPGAVDVAGTVEAVALPLLDRSARVDKPVPIYPSPMVTVEVVLGTVPGPVGALLSRAVAGRDGRVALAGAGWKPPGAATPPSGLPEPGVLDALGDVVAEGAR